MKTSPNDVKEGETNKDYYEKGSEQKSQVTAVQLKKLEQVCLCVCFFFVMKKIMIADSELI